MIHLKRIFSFLAVGAGIIVFMLMVVFGQSDKEMLEKTWNKLKLKDSLYVDNLYVTDSTFTQFHTFRKVRPLKESDVEKMSIPSWKKLKLIAQLDTTTEHARPVMIDAGPIMLQEDFFKHQTGFIGTFVRSDSTTGIFNETIYIPLKWHVIKPNTILCNTEFKREPMPPNYTYADSDIYVDIKIVQLNEPNIFKLKKH